MADERGARPGRGRRRAGGATGLVLLLLAGCGGGEVAGSSLREQCPAPRVVATTSILGDVVGRIVGEGVEVLIPVGADPHSFEASARQAAALREADLVVVNGLGLEEGMGGVIRAASAEGATVVEAAAFITPLPIAPLTTSAGEQGWDPHLWTDPRRMADVVTGLGEALAAADPACAPRWRAAAEEYRQELLDLDAGIEALVSGIPAERRKLVTNHQTLGYFADRYGFVVVGTIIPGGTTLAEPSPADLATLVETLRREGVRAVFAENTRPADLARTLAAELGEQVTVVALYTDSLGGPGSGAETYLGMMRTDAERIAAALGAP